MNILEYENYHENKTHVEPSFPYNTFLCTIPLDFSRVPLHWHDEMELIYVKKGRGYVTVDFQKYEVSGNTIVLILPGQLHSIEQYDVFSMEYENIIFDPVMLFPKKEDSSSTEFLRPLFSGKIMVPTIFPSHFKYYSSLSSCIDACDEIRKTKPEGYDLFIKGKLYEFFFLLSSQCRMETKPLKPQSLGKIKIVLKYIEHNYMNKIKIADAAELLDFSESHFMRYFKKTMGTSFINYLKEYRLTMAARLLLASDSLILPIAEETGFDNLSYFNREFKAYYGMTPKEYRKNS